MELGHVQRAADEAKEAAENTLAQSIRMADSLETIAGKMRKQGRAITMNSVGAYTVFTLLLGAAFFMLYSHRASVLVATAQEAKEARARAEARAVAADLRLLNQQTSAEAARKFHRLLQAGKHQDVVIGYDDLSDEHLTPTERAVFAEGVHASRKALLGEAQAVARRLLGTEKGAKAETELRHALFYAEEEETATAQYLLGRSLFQQKRDYEAVLALEKALALGAEGKKESEEARFYLGAAFQRLGEKWRARRGVQAFYGSKA